MVALLFGLLCTGVFLILLAVRGVYYCVPAKELKRLARTGDVAGAQLFRVVAFGGSLAILLWFLIGLFAAGAFVLFGVALPWWGVLAGSAAVVWLGFGGLMQSHPRSWAVQVAVFLAPVLAGTLARLQPVLEPTSRFAEQHRRVFDHTRLYEKQDLAELLQKQKAQADSRVAPEEVELLERALSFGDKTAGDIVLPRQKVRMVRADETIGPKLMDELHQSGQRDFPVYEADGGERVVALVRLDDLVRAKQGGRVESVADPHIAFVRDDFTLPEVLQAFRHAGQQVLIVINNFEEFVGIITLDKLFEALLGEAQPATLAYDDRTTVAQHKPAPPPPSQEPEATEQMEATDQAEPAN